MQQRSVNIHATSRLNAGGAPVFSVINPIVKKAP